MESLVSEPIETALREVPEIKEISSTSKAGLSVVSVELYDSIEAHQVDAIWSEVRDKLGEINATLPPAAANQNWSLTNPLASTMIIALRWLQDSPMQQDFCHAWLNPCVLSWPTCQAPKLPNLGRCRRRTTDLYRPLQTGQR